MSALADYDKYDYDYATYWGEREYEHQAEVYALGKLISNNSGKRFIDVGGSYGRLLPTYKDNYEEIVILDYSIKTLQRNRDLILKISPNTQLIAGNAYKMPFRDNSFDGGLMVRVLHHLTNPSDYFHEQYRILSSQSDFFLEIPNKIHAKARIRALLKGDRSMFDEKPQQQPSKGNEEGSKGEYVPFLNFHPLQISKQLKEAGLVPVEKRSCSFLRSTPVARKTSTKTSMKIESTLSSMLKSSNLTPSIFYHLSVTEKKGESCLHNKLTETFVCPKCKGELNAVSSEQFTCAGDNLSFELKDGVWDFRYDESE